MTKATSSNPHRQLELLIDRLFYCPACTTWRTSRLPRTRLRRALPKVTERHASTLSGNTAVNATKTIPPHYQALYRALTEVRTKASAHLNLSRLQLALQSLESETPVTRVAFLGLNVQDTARKIVRLLLADALEKEGRWERELDSKENNDDYNQGLLIRYGHPPNSSLPQSRSTVPVLYVPAPVLERNNIEILVSSVGALSPGDGMQSVQTTSSDAFLSPTIGTPTAASGRQTIISQPVHSCLLVGNGLDELAAIAELLASTKITSQEDREAISVAINFVDHRPGGGKILAVDTVKAQEGLAAIRRSLGEATVYEHKWVDSGMPGLSKWFTLSSSVRSSKIPPSPVRALISSLLITATANLQAQSLLSSQARQVSGPSLATRTNLESTIDEFSRNAHEELQSGLASAWSSRNWRKLAWYKLFWRVDDVGLIVTDLVTNAWLPRTERAVYELSGRLAQAGISPVDVLQEQPQPRIAESNAVKAQSTRTQVLPILQAQLATDPTATEPVIINPTGTANVTMQPVPQPLPLSSSISTTRAVHMEQAITELTTTSQQLVLRTLSVTGLSAGLSGLTYLSLTPGSFYEAGTIVALGTAFALWQMQGGWQRATKALEDGLFEEGRAVIQRIVERMKFLVRQSGEVLEDPVEVQVRREAEVAVQKAREELDKVSSS